MEEQKDLEQQKQTAEPSQEDAQAKTQQSEESGLPKTQQELDELIERRIARERKRLAKQGAAQKGETTGAAQETAQTAPEESAAVKELSARLIAANAQLEAYKSGVSAEAAEDAVLLALHQIEKNGDEPDEESIREALAAVLKRHPEWKKEEKKGGIKVGAQEGRADEKDAGRKPFGGATFF